jgi:hypothetical protein
MIQRKVFKKWFWITVLCSAHSFFWGAMGGSNIIAMLLGIITLVCMFAAIESHPYYQSRRVANPHLAKALDFGIRLRCWLAVYIPVSMLLQGIFAGLHFHKALIMILLTPYMAEIYIGVGSTSLMTMLTGIAFPMPNASFLDNALFTYFSTVLTGLMHTAILAVICMSAYGVIRLRTRNM